MRPFAVAMPLGIPVAILLAIAFGGVTSPSARAADTSDEAAYVASLTGLVNQYRVRRGLRPLTIDPTASALAREHSAAMAKQKRLGHDEFPSRVRRSGHAICVENVGFNYQSPAGQFEGWRTSPGHDRNMLDPRVDSLGIGVVSDYVTLVACGN